MSSNEKKRKRKREKRGSLNYQIHMRMQELKCIGESRFQAKLEYKEAMGGGHQNNRTTGIHSYNTYKGYKQTSEQFVKWLKDNNKSVRNIEDITREHIIEYIQYRAAQGKSASTYSKDMAALNKIFLSDISEETKKINKMICGVENKSFDKISNNRELKEHHKKINLEKNYQLEMLVGRATGMRRESYTIVTPNDFNRDINNQVISVNLKEKNGKRRTAYIRDKYREELTKFVDTKKENEKLFKTLSKKFPAHRFRQQYARGLYDEYIEKHGVGKKGYLKFDEKSLLNVSENLGHNRDYVVKHYLCVEDYLDSSNK